MASHPGQRIIFFDIAEIFGKAYNKTTSIGSAIKGFERCGIWPFSDQIFDDEDFAAARVTDEPKQVATEISDDPQTPVATSPTHTGTSKEITTTVEADTETSLSDAHLERISYIPSTSAGHPECVAEELCATPKSRISRVHVRRVEQSQVLTDSSFKNKLEEKKKKKSLKRMATRRSSSHNERKSNVKMQEYYCIVCVEAYSDSRSGEKWIQCGGACGQWAHEDCTPGIGVYVCHICDSDESD